MKERDEKETEKRDGKKRERMKDGKKKRRQTKNKILYLLIELIVFLFGKKQNIRLNSMPWYDG